ncbi:dephospho-CoA kinase [Marinithermus hydrothermalis]|uniref:Dephospho-CoA kinase n=1 Tax=Marinithermus hydrothermalis (strain DSM 14884 / JCM 11576 / T1) TaxID=869210 RepID=F2NQI8_MARHT|nr:dephospho-CoA kinase [Marinithermus hydrothermalis]AEB11926.1 Dephospho-CoA kinase [Marinithermus hydrothermalis DSM 14884]
MRRIGLTGSIGSGKSTVARMLERRGLPVIDADQLAREAAQAMQGEICRAFPEACRGSVLDRARLAEIVFRDPAARERLERLIHPYVRRRMAQEIARLEQRPVPPPAVILEIPLLFEGGLERGLDGVLVVTAPDAVRMQRVQVRSGLDPEAFRARDAAQMPQAEKARRADWVIENAGDLEALERAVEAWYREVILCEDRA